MIKRNPTKPVRVVPPMMEEQEVSTITLQEWLDREETVSHRFFVKFGGNLFFISTVFFFLNPIKSCRYVCFLVTLKTPHH